MVHELARQMNRETRDTLWCWILGNAYQYLYSRIGKEQYEQEVYEINEDCQKLNPNVYNQRTYPEGEEEEKKTANTKDIYSVKLTSKNREVGTVMMERDLKLMLYRHWTLYDSMKNSNYTVSKLFTWKEPGEKELLKFFVTIGVPLDQAKQLYDYLDSDVREKLKERILEATSGEFNQMHDILMDSFIR